MRRLIVLALAGFVAGSMVLLTACGSLSFAKPPGQTESVRFHRRSHQRSRQCRHSRLLSRPHQRLPSPHQCRQYPQDITDAGIVAPVNWINNTGQILLLGLGQWDTVDADR